VSLPINFMGRGFTKATFEIASPARDSAEPVVPATVIPLYFNPKEYKLKKENTFVEIPIPGLGTPPLQYGRGGSEVLTMELLADTTDTLKSVRTEYVDKLRKLLDKDEKLHAPPIVTFVWAEMRFRGVLTSLEVTYQMFHTDGTPLRALMNAAMKEYRPEAKIELAKQSSPDVEKRYVVRAGETLSSIAFSVLRDCAEWRAIAVANGITDPRRVAPGTVLTIPRLGVQPR
jgi:nucleoid-associated protein YgaU